MSFIYLWIDPPGGWAFLKYKKVDSKSTFLKNHTKIPEIFKKCPTPGGILKTRAYIRRQYDGSMRAMSAIIAGVRFDGAM